MQFTLICRFASGSREAEAEREGVTWPKPEALRLNHLLLGFISLSLALSIVLHLRFQRVVAPLVDRRQNEALSMYYF